MIVDKLIRRINALKAPIVVGLDPRLDQIPVYLLEENRMKGDTPSKSTARAILAFNKKIIDAIHDIVPAVKPQIAMYEEWGTNGVTAYHSTVSYAREKGLIVIGDVKRGDIASTAESYSKAYLSEADNEKRADFITINPYMGFDSVEPYLSDCCKYDKGLFVLVKTSNPGSRDLQDLLMLNNKPLYTHVAGLVEKWGEPFIGEHGYSAVGAVIGATHPKDALEIRNIMPHTFFLIPGYGVQGGSGKDLKPLWRTAYGAIVNNSRGITGAYQTKKYHAPDAEFHLAARAAVLDMKTDLEI